MTKTTKATKAYNEHTETAHELLSEIGSLLHTMTSQQQARPRDWGFAGSAEHTVAKLIDIRDFLNGNPDR